MKSNLAKSVAAAALLTAAIASNVAPASAAQNHHPKSAHLAYVRVVPTGPANIGPVPAATSPDWQPDYFGYVRGPVYGYGPLPGVPQFGGAPQGINARLAQADASCAQRFRSYDPASGTYIGRDGRRRACR